MPWLVGRFANQICISLQGIGVTYRTQRGPVEAISMSAWKFAREFVALLGRAAGKYATAGDWRPARPDDRSRGSKISTRTCRPASQPVRFRLSGAGTAAWRSALGNVQLHSKWSVARRRSSRSAASIWGRVGLVAFKDNLPHELSGGMKQRVAIVRPGLGSAVLLMDEPFSALDEMTRNPGSRRLLQLWAEDRKTITLLPQHREAVTWQIASSLCQPDRADQSHLGDCFATRAPGMRQCRQFLDYVVQARRHYGHEPGCDTLSLRRAVGNAFSARDFPGGNIGALGRCCADVHVLPGCSCPQPDLQTFLIRAPCPTTPA